MENSATFMEKLTEMKKEIGKRIKGYEKEIDLCLAALAASGHVLFTAVPGLAKTLLARTIAETSGCSFKRIQLTPDLTPADITGVEIWRPDMQDWEPRKGPIVANIVLADEINRTPPKIQSAFLEAMQEGEITLGNFTIPLPSPFIVFATRNPIEHEGVYPLPEAQLDRFLFEIIFPYPDEKDEIDIAKQGNDKPVQVSQIWNPEGLTSLASFVSKNVFISESVYKYAVELVRETRSHPQIELGASPRASQKLIAASKAHAFVIRNKTFVTPEDIDEVLEPLLMPRLIMRRQLLEEGTDQDSRKEIIRKIREEARARHIERS